MLDREWLMESPPALAPLQLCSRCSFRDVGRLAGRSLVAAPGTFLARLMSMSKNSSSCGLRPEAEPPHEPRSTRIPLFSRVSARCFRCCRPPSLRVRSRCSSDGEARA